MAEGTYDNIPNEVSAEMPMTSNGSITVGRRQYAVGLLWQPLQNSDDPMNEIREAIDNDISSDLYCLRPASTYQYGLGKKSMGHRAGEPSAAAAVASALSEYTSVAAVFPVQEGWWLLGVRNDLILSEEDALYKTEQEAHDAFYQLMGMPDWHLKIAPASWGIDKAQELSLESLLKKNASRVVLEEVGSTQKTPILVIIAIVLIAIVVGALYFVINLWSTIFPDDKIEVQPIPEAIQPVEPVPEKPKPWEKIPKLDSFLFKCWNNSYQLTNLTIPGWQVGNMTCTYTGLTTGWSKSWGRIAWLKAAINEYKMSRVNVQLNQDGASASGQIVFSDIPLVASVPVIDEQKLWEELTDIKQATNMPLSFTRQTMLDPPDNPDGSKPANQQEYVFYQFSITTPYTPFELRTFFEKFPGLELTTINFNPAPDAQDKWKYEGRIYAK